jgi:hypothetical protein
MSLDLLHEVSAYCDLLRKELEHVIEVSAAGRTVTLARALHIHVLLDQDPRSQARLGADAGTDTLRPLPMDEADEPAVGDMCVYEEGAFR